MQITLQNGDAKAVIDTLGGAPVSLMKAGKEYIWHGDKEFWAGRAPLLFPFVGGLRDGKALIGGKEYSMPRHGFIRFMEFSVVEQSDATAVVRFVANEESKQQYPFDFTFDVAYTLSENALDAVITVQNDDAAPLPFTLGFHNGYYIEPEDFDSCVVTLEKPETVATPAVVVEEGLLDFTRRTPFLKDENRFDLKHSLFDIDAIVMDEIQSRKVVLENPGKRKITVEFPDFGHVMFWSTAKHAPFLCIEPVSGYCTTTEEGDVFEDKAFMEKLPSGEKKSYRMKVTVG